MSRLHASSACCPSSASLMLKLRPSRMRRATLRMTLESSTTRQVFIVALLPTHAPTCTFSLYVSSRGQGIAARFKDAVDVENHHELSFEAMHAAGHPLEMLVEVDGIGLARPVGQLEHFAHRIDQEPVGLALEFDADGHRRAAVPTRRQPEPAPHVDGGDDAATQVEHAGDLRRGQGYARQP